MNAKSYSALLCFFLAGFVSADPLEDAALYDQACAACHGADGRGRPVEDRGFELELPDFTDCEFASRGA